MTNQKSLLLLSIVATCLFLTSCEPSVIKEDMPKLLAACAGHPQWVGKEIYDFTINKYETETTEKYKKEHAGESGDDLWGGDFVYEPGDDMWNLQVLKESEDDYGDRITENDLDEFLQNGERPESNVSYSTAFANAFWGAALGVGNEMKSKTRAFKTAYEICEGNFEPIKENICKKVEIYDYRENKAASSKKVTVYDVVYKINGQSYVWCTVHDLGETFEVNYVNSSNLFSNLGF